MESYVKKSSGFTLIEVLIAMTVLTIGILGMEQLSVIQIRGNAISKKMTIANQIAMDIIEKAKNAPFYAFSNGAPSLPVPCQLASPNNTIIDCLKPDTTDATVPAAPYNTFTSDANYIWINTLPQYTQISNLQIKRVVTITPLLPLPADQFQRLKTIDVIVYWRDPGNPTKIHSVEYVTTRDIGME